ncbi:MAG: zinc dependent phospholipase C family protein [Bacteroidota bacterium]
MKRLWKILIFSVVCSIPIQAIGWGFWAHQRINRMAVFTLPRGMFGFYKAYIEFITKHAVDPDKRRYAVDGEAPRHYIDIDHYGELPFDNVPHRWNEAVEAFSEDTLQAYGILPWHIPVMVYRLRDAMKARNLPRILKLSADLGHYVGDAHVPLHTTENYNGQLTGQKGIHGFWESRLPELYGSSYDFFVGRAYYIDDVVEEGWDAVLESHRALDSVLHFEADLNTDFSPDRKYGYESRNAVTVRAYSRPYSRAYHAMLDGMVERRMRLSVRRLGSYWYTAWKMAGEPDLKSLIGISPHIPPDLFEKKLQIIDREDATIGFLLRVPSPQPGPASPVEELPQYSGYAILPDGWMLGLEEAVWIC